MSKRAAAVQLTSDNFEQDDKDCEEPGQFEQASEDQLKQRVIKKAARRTNMANGGGMGGGLFAGLKTSATPSLGFGVGSAGIGAGLLGRAPLSSVGQSNTMNKPITTDLQSNGVASSSVANGSSGYLKQLQALNTDLSKWISSHVEKNPHVDLTPIFRDYEKHLKTIDMKYKPLSETESSQESDCGEGSSQATPTTQGEESDYAGGSSSQATTHETGTEDEEMNATGEDEDSQGSSKQLNLATTTSFVAESADDGSLFAVRAKLFYKKKDEFTELGVGTLKVQGANGESVCLLLRNDTSIGNILMNVRVTSDVPMTLTKNNLMVVCPANPPLGKGGSDSGAVTYLIRVKTAQLAEKLHTSIQESLK